MARKDYPFSKRDVKKGGKLVSSLLTGLFLSPFLIENAVLKSIDYGDINTIDDTLNKKEAILLFVLCIILSPLVYILVKLGIILCPFPILGVFAFIGLICFPLLIWIGSLCCVIKAFIPRKQIDLKKIGNEILVPSGHIHQDVTTDKKKQLTLSASVELSPIEIKLCETYIDAGRNFNTNIVKKRLHVGRNVLRKSDNNPVIVINKTRENNYICLDLGNRHCDLYTRNDLVLF